MDQKNSFAGKVIVPVIVAVIALVAIVGVGNLANRNQSQQSQTQVQGATQEKKQAVVEITDKNQETTSYNVTFNDGESAFDIMKKLSAEVSTFTFEYKTSSFGSYITSINGYVPESNEFWKFIVNGTDSQVGVSEYKVNKDDNLKFVVDEIKF